MVFRSSIPVLAAAATVALSAAWAPLARAKEEGLVLHYDFKDGAEGVLRDKSGNGHNGKIHGAIWKKTKHGAALWFDGIDDQVDCGHPAALKFAGSFSLAVWVKHDTTSGWQDYVGDYIGGESGYVIAQNDGMLFFQNAGANPYTITTEEELIYSGVWHHVVAVYNRDDGAMLVYVDGMERVSVKVAGAPKSASGAPLRLGAYQGRRECFKGLLGDVKLHSRPLSEAEVMAQFSSDARSKGPRQSQAAPKPTAPVGSRKVLMGMRLERAEPTDEGIVVVTTGAELLFGKDGVVRCFQRIPVRRELTRLTLPAGAMPLKLGDVGDFACNISGNGIGLTVQGDSLMILRTPKGTKLSFEGLFKPAYRADKEGKWLFIDPKGGFGVYPVGAQKTSAPELSDKSWSVRYDLKRSEEIWVSIFPPRPFNWKRSFESLAHEGGRKPLEKYAYPSNELIRDVARFCKVFAVHSYIFPGGDKAPWLIPAFVPSDMKEFARVRDEVHGAGMKLIPYFSPYYYRGPDFPAEIRRALDEHKVDGLYFDGVSMDFRKSYQLTRKAREMLGDDRLLYVHCSSDPLGSKTIYCPFIDTYSDYILRGEAGRGGQSLDAFLRYIVSGYNISNAVGVWCYYGSTGAAGYVHKVPTSPDIDAALRNHVRLWRTKVVWQVHGKASDEAVDAFDREYYGKIDKLRAEKLGK